MAMTLKITVHNTDTLKEDADVSLEFARRDDTPTLDSIRLSAPYCSDRTWEINGDELPYELPSEWAFVFPCSLPVCEDTWTDWSINSWWSSPHERCQEWSVDSKWGALQDSRTLEQSCSEEWAQNNCAATCGC